MFIYLKQIIHNRTQVVYIPLIKNKSYIEGLKYSNFCFFGAKNLLTFESHEQKSTSITKFRGRKNERAQQSPQFPPN